MDLSSIREFFSDWATIQPGSWSVNGRKLPYANDRYVEIGLYREPADNGEYAGSYTLHIFDGDDVIFCQKVEGMEKGLPGAGSRQAEIC